MHSRSSRRRLRRRRRHRLRLRWSLRLQPARPPLPHLRIARPSDRLDACVAFYRDAAGLSVLGGFQEHAGFDGVMLGLPGAAWHLELTHQRGHSVGNAPNADHLIVLYHEDRASYDAAVARFTRHGCAPVPSYNPYWDAKGKTFADPDGYRVVVHDGGWAP